jgi:hypothetical protein
MKDETDFLNAHKIHVIGEAPFIALPRRLSENKHLSGLNISK